jgi:hypothetical protein
MNEAKQAELLPTMPEKDLAKLIKRLEEQVADLEGSIADYEKSITVAGVMERRAQILAVSPDAIFPRTPEQEVVDNRYYYGKTDQTRKAKLITKTRRLNAAREEVGKRNRQVIFGSRESLA